MVDDEKQVRPSSVAQSAAVLHLRQTTCAACLAVLKGCRISSVHHPAGRNLPHNNLPSPLLSSPPWPQVIVAERGPLVWVFNFSPFNTYEGLQVGRQHCVGCVRMGLWVQHLKGAAGVRFAKGDPFWPAKQSTAPAPHGARKPHSCMQWAGRTEPQPALITAMRQPVS